MGPSIADYENRSSRHSDSLTDGAKKNKDMIKRFVEASNGTFRIQRVLIANNGLAAVKEIRSIRKWAYATFNDDKAITFIAMATPEDVLGNAEFVTMADEIIQVPGGPNSSNYANVKVIVDSAQQAKVHAVWAGWGHASENPKLPEELSKLNIAFIGPTAGAMNALGDKISSMIIAQAASVPCLSWSGSGLTANPDHKGKIKQVDPSIYRKACITSVDVGLEMASQIGFPLMIKASEGGGGKGIRCVEKKEDFAPHFDSVQREVPGSPIFLMKLASTARHLEVQILADKYGQVVALSGRDCSVQRRHQKIIEEAPVTVFNDEDEWRKLECAAVRLAKLVGYESAGTVEYLYDIESKEISFLELNPRLQVEHPCTEMITGVNLPAAQLQVAMGIPLDRIRDIRAFFGRDSTGNDAIDFDQETSQPPNGHVIACRLTAENPEAGFKPGGGKLIELTFRSAPNVWGYFSIKSSSLVHEYADSQFGHIFAWGHTRPDARNAMVLALKEMTLRSEFRTTVEYLVKLLETETFRGCRQTTAWLDGLIKGGFGVTKLDSIQTAAAGAVWIVLEQLEKKQNDAKALLSKGQIPPIEFFDRRCAAKFILNKTQYSIQARESGPQSLIVALKGTEVVVTFSRQADNSILASMLGGRNFNIFGRQEAAGLLLSVNGSSFLLENENDPTVVRTPSPGKLIRYLVEDGQLVSSGTAIAEIEVMKMYMTLNVSNAGKIKPTRSSGSALEAGDIIANISLLDPTKVQLAKENEAGFPLINTEESLEHDLAQKYHALEKLLWNAILGGYSLCEIDKKQAVEKYLQAVLNPQLALVCLEQLISNVANRMNAETRELLESHIQKGLEGTGSEVPNSLNQIKSVLEEFTHICDDRDIPSIKNIVDTVSQHLSGPFLYAERRIAELCEMTFSDAVLFDESLTNESVYQKLRVQHNDNWDLIYRSFVAAVSCGEERQVLLASLLRTTVKHLPAGIGSQSPLIKSLRKLAKLSNPAFQRLGRVAKEVLVSCQLPSLVEIREKMEEKLKTHDVKNHAVFIKEMVSGFAYHVDLLPNFFTHSSRMVRTLALEIYIKRIFEAFDFLEASIVDEDIFTWIVAAPQMGNQEKMSLNDTLVWEQYERRSGAFTAFNNEDEAKQQFIRLVEKLSPDDATKNVIYFALPDSGESEEEVLMSWVPFMQRQDELLKKHDIKRVTMIKVLENSFTVGFYTFREILNWREDCQVRHIEPAMSYLLELPRMLENYKIKLLHADPTGQIHIYRGDALKVPGQSRLFIRVVVRPVQTMKGHNTLQSLAEDAKSIFNDVLDAVAMVLAKNPVQFSCNHLYINVVPNFYAQPESAKALFLALTTLYEDKLKSLRVMEGEIQMLMSTRKGEPAEKYRFYLFHHLGCVSRVDVYKEVRSAEHKKAVLCLIDSDGQAPPEASVDCQKVSGPHRILSDLQIKRNKVQALGTTFVYDFPALFEKAIDLQWATVSKEKPERACEFVELILAKEDGQLIEVSRDAGQNSIGMVAWKVTIKTIDCTEARCMIVIANDMEHQLGSFGIDEDKLFFEASKLARRNGWPRIYLSANSGARIGVAEELRGLICAKWKNPDDPMQGFGYLYLEERDFPRVKHLVRAEYVDCEKHYMVTDILDGLGVENLSGSAMIASETSLSYLKNFTLTFVTGRSVGIGAYLVRLGQRVIQKINQPIILTGVQALNQVLGREVYNSNLQIGGPQIMANNGISHRTVHTDLEGVQEILTWLSFVPNGQEPVPRAISTMSQDVAPRDVEYHPPRLDGGKFEEYDARRLVTGVHTSTGFAGGLLDRGSFIEYLPDWAKSVIVGRGRLGGVPVAVILVETRMTEKHISADPASLMSASNVISQAGQVWYPDSAFKTAQFIKDCNHGERLPLIILANWRGFSGGQRDLFEEILKFGSYIVDALREYQQPVFVYLPPGAQLRGGSWVVVDGAINPDQIEMYADPTARGGILEPEGLVSIKFRGKKLGEWAARTIPGYEKLPDERKEQLLTVAHQVACSFVDLHDRPGRMVELGVIRGIVEWKHARRFFIYRLRVRLLLYTLVSFAKATGYKGTEMALRNTIMDVWLPQTNGFSNRDDVESAVAIEANFGVLQAKIEQVIHGERLKNLEQQLRGLSEKDRNDIFRKVMERDEKTPHGAI